MRDPHRKMIALWVAVGGTMALVIALWAMLLPMQLGSGTLIGAREISQWQVFRPQAENVSKSWDETMAKWQELVDQVQDQSRTRREEAEARISESEIKKLRARIEAASARSETAPQ